MNINSINYTDHQISTVKIDQQKAPVHKSDEEKVQVPKDGYQSHKPGFIERTVDKISDFIKENIMGPASVAGEKLRTDFGTQAAVTGGVVGGAIGAYLGYDAGKMEMSHAKQATLTWQEPNMTSKHLGNIPSDYYSWSRWDWHSYHFDSNNGGVVGGSPVYRDVPVYNQDGSVRMHDVTKTIDSQRFGPTSGLLGGMALGTIGGTLLGVSVGLIHKVIKGKEGKE